MVPFVVEHHLTDHRGQTGAGLLLDEQRGVARDVPDAVRSDGVAQRLAQQFADLIAGAQSTAETELIAGRVELVLLIDLEEGEAGSDVSIETIALAAAGI